MAWGRRVGWAELVAALLVVANFLLLGLPGALFVEPVAGVLQFLRIKPSPDAYWPAAIWVGIVAPAGFLLAIVGAAGRRSQAGAAELVGWGALGYAVAACAIAAILLATG